MDFSEFDIIIGLLQLKTWAKKIWKIVALVMKKVKNRILARQTLGATDVKLGMHTQPDSGSNMGRVPPGHTSFLIL